MEYLIQLTYSWIMKIISHKNKLYLNLLILDIKNCNLTIRCTTGVNLRKKGEGNFSPQFNWWVSTLWILNDQFSDMKINILYINYLYYTLILHILHNLYTYTRRDLQTIFFHMWILNKLFWTLILLPTITLTSLNLCQYLNH